MKSKTKTYVWSILVTLAVGGLSALLTRKSMDVYETVTKPPLAPPAVLFPIVWGILYVIMGISIAMILLKGRSEGIYTVPCVKIYALQLAVNFFWSIIFFNLRAFFFSFVWLILLWILVVVMIDRFSRVSKIAAYINIPYFLWVSFAAYLNFMIYRLNM
ncbi:MAG: tryptophan-rich sensory protein [Clostridia bacterium]|nr:tryptophan-rich sensory protein [Clostridia bacterium]